MIRILHAARVQSGNGKMLDLELLLNQVGGIFKPNGGYGRRREFASSTIGSSSQPELSELGSSCERTPSTKEE